MKSNVMMSKDFPRHCLFLSDARRNIITNVPGVHTLCMRLLIMLSTIHIPPIN